MRFGLVLFVVIGILLGCAQKPPIDEQMLRFDGEMPANFEGSWQRDYARGDEPGAVLNRVMFELSRTQPDVAYPGTPGAPGGSRLSQAKMESLLAIARLAELITRSDLLTIDQTDTEISVAREDDFAIFCAFYDGVAKATETPYGREVCGWDDENLISLLQLPDGLSVVHRFTISEDRDQLRVTTTVSSTTAPAPFTLNRFFRRFEPGEGEFRCVETLSKKRVCSTGELDL